MPHPTYGLRVLIVAALSLVAHAQESRTISCRFLGFQTPDEESLICVAEGQEVKCPYQTTGISDPVKLVAVENALHFIDEKNRKPACTVRVAPSARQLLIIVMPNAKGAKTPWRGFAIEDAEKKFPNGGALVVNLHTTNIRFTIGEHKYMLKPGDQHGVVMPKLRDDFNMATSTFEFSHSEQWIIASESRLRYTEGLRYLMLTYTDPTSQRPRLSTYQDDPFKPFLVKEK